MRVECRERNGHVAAVLLLTTRIEFRVAQARDSRLITIGPAIVRSVFDGIHRVRRFVSTKMVRTHVSRIEPISDPAQATALRRPRAKCLRFLPSGSISRMLARTSSFSSQALQLLPTET